jgi:hypothetical protein
LAASFLAGQLPSLEGVEAESVICRTREGWTVQRRFLLLAEDQFNESFLSDVFAAFLQEPDVAEMYVLASSDPEFFRARTVLESEVGVHLTDSPVAYFFRIGANAFFQFGRSGGPIRWVVLEGENVLRRRFGNTDLWWAGHLIGTLGGEERCEKGNLKLAFVSPEVHEEDLSQVARYYARLARHWGSFSFALCPSFETAAKFQELWFISLEAMPVYQRIHKRENPEPVWSSYLSYAFIRWSPTARHGTLMRYDREGFGPPAWQKELILDDPGPKP